MDKTAGLSEAAQRLRALYNARKVDTGTDDARPLASVDPLIQMCRLADVRPDAKTDTDFYPDSDKPPFCWMQFKTLVRNTLQSFRWDPDAVMDAEVAVWLSPDNLEAWCAVLPPLNGGREVSEDMIRHALQSRNVTEGLREDALTFLRTPLGYMALTCVAVGEPSMHGLDGQLIDLITDPNAGTWKEDEKGRINFAEKNWILNVSAGQKIGEIVPPTEGTDGFDVTGKVLIGKPGRALQKSHGKNTKLSDDGKYIISGVDGQLIAEKNRLSVSEILTINGDIDYNTGNVRANGTVIIYGNVSPGFQVQAKYDIIIHGTVEGATILAGRDINILGGVMASREGSLHSGRDLRVKFMENGHAYAGGDAYFENLILCDVSAEGNVSVTSGRGSVIGGSVTAMGDIRIGTVGNRTYRATTIHIGGTEAFLERKRICNEDLEEARASWHTADENLRKLELHKDNPQVAEVYSRQENIRNLAEIKVNNLKRRLDALVAEERGTLRHHIYIDRVYPNVTVSIGNSAQVTHQELRATAFALRHGEITMVDI